MVVRLRESRRAELYRSWARMLDAGVPVLAVFEHSKLPFGGAETARLIDALRHGVGRGAGIAESLETVAPTTIPPIHRAVIAAAERSGHVADALRELADDDERSAAERAAILRASAYPIALFHLAVFATNAGTVLVAPGATLVRILLLVVPVDVALVLLFQVLLGTFASGSVTRFVRSLPGVGGAIRVRDHSRFFRAVARLYEAGVPIRDAAQGATAAIADDGIRDQVIGAFGPAKDPEPFATVARRIPAVESSALLCIVTSEPAGELGQGLERAAALTHERWLSSSTRIGRMTGRLLFLAAAVYAAWTILSFWIGYFDQFKKLR